MSTTTADTPQVLLEHHLKALRLPTMLREYDKLARTCAVEKANFPNYLLRLTELELLDRDRRATERRIRQAKFPVVKSLDSFDFLAIPALNKTLVLELTRCEYLARKENILLLGNSGTGKTHIALALGLAACQRGPSRPLHHRRRAGWRIDRGQRRKAPTPLSKADRRLRTANHR
jgi:DNA replication protein DnaC